MAKKAEILCEYQGYIDHPPIDPAALYGQAASNDRVTVDSWRGTWLKNARANKDKFGSFKERGVGKLLNRHRGMPAVLVGSGPSLRDNAVALKDKGSIPSISCLHNFHFMEDNGVSPDYYVTLDAGPITIEEVSEGGSRTPDEYWAMTKGKTLIAYISSDPRLLEKWQGEVYFFACPLPDQALMDEMDAIEKFHTFLSTGGNVLGACLYFSKAILGCQTSIFVGANFSFSYLEKFHGWDSKYDLTLGHCVRATDVYGNSVKTWQSYHNFKAWFDWVTMKVPGVYFNCTEGGTFGAYPGGNLRSVTQMDLKDCLRMFNLSDELKDACENPETDIKKILF